MKKIYKSIHAFHWDLVGGNGCIRGKTCQEKKQECDRAEHVCWTQKG